jgi:hydroxymethylpyrimidine kinase/phosphomethylpyrimidine kinase/thiamine-phosphate diphosphorylase
MAVAEFLRNATAFVVCDPVMIATRGGTLLENGALGVLRDQLLPRVDLLTPNLSEAERMVSCTIDSTEEMEKAARDLLRYGVKSVLLKGGHFEGPFAQDYWTDGRHGLWLTSPRVDTAHTHGGGCTLSSAIAAAVALGYTVHDALVIAKACVNQGLRLGRAIGAGRGPLAHEGWPGSPGDLPWITATAAAGRARPEFPPEAPLGLYPIVDRATWLERLLPAGVSMVQLRVKDLRGDAIEKEVNAGIETARRFKARLYINDHWELAIKYGAHGVHIGQDDMAGTDIAALQRAGLRLGLSTHGYAEVARAMAVRPSYVAIGTLFRSPSKTFEHAPMGLTEFTRLRKLVACPVVAIGGITAELAPQVRAAGADGLAVISDITRAPDLPARIAQWNDALSITSDR